MAVAHGLFDCSICLQFFAWNVSTPFGINSRISEYSCPGCRQTFTPRPVLKRSMTELKQACEPQQLNACFHVFLQIPQWRWIPTWYLCLLNSHREILWSSRDQAHLHLPSRFGTICFTEARFLQLTPAEPAHTLVTCWHCCTESRPLSLNIFTWAFLLV